MADLDELKRERDEAQEQYEPTWRVYRAARDAWCRDPGSSELHDKMASTREEMARVEARLRDAINAIYKEVTNG